MDIDQLKKDREAILAQIKVLELQLEFVNPAELRRNILMSELTLLRRELIYNQRKLIQHYALNSA
jgi:hypothetical protein